MKSVRPGRPSPSMVMAMISLFVALSGSAAALSGKGSVKSNDLQRHAVTKPKIAPDAVIRSKIKTNAVNNEQLAGGAVTTDKLAEGAVTGSRVRDKSLTGDDLGDKSLTGANVRDKSITGAQIDESTLSGVPVSGIAGGDLGGTYPNPSIGSGVITPANVDPANVDGGAGVPSLRTLGSGASQAMPGNATPGGPPTGTAGGDLGGSYPNPEIANGAVGADKIGALPAARVVLNDQPPGGLLPIANETFVNLPWLHVEYNVGGVYDIDDFTRLTAPVDGIYLISTGLMWSGVEPQPTGVIGAAITLNGTNEELANAETAWLPIGADPSQSLVTQAALSAGDFVEVQVFQNSGSAKELLLEDSHFELTWLAPAP